MVDQAKAMPHTGTLINLPTPALTDSCSLWTKQNRRRREKKQKAFEKHKVVFPLLLFFADCVVIPQPSVKSSCVGGF